MPTLSCPSCQTAVEVPSDPAAGPPVCPDCGTTVAPPAPPDVPATPPAEPEAAAFPVLPFAVTPAGRPGGLGLAVAFGVVAALVLGVLAGLLREHFWLVVVFPLMHGAAVGGLAGLGARLGRCRMPRAVGLIGGGCAALSAAGLYYLDYLAIPEPIRQIVGFWDYMDLRATAGVKLGKPGQGDKGMNLGYVGSIIYWLVEIGIGAAAGAAAGAGVVSSPFCTDCRGWKTKRTLGPYRVEPHAAVTAVAAGVPAAAAVPAEGAEQKQVTLAVYTCPGCGDRGTADVQVTGTHAVKKEVATFQAFMTYPGPAVAAFDDLDRQLREAGLAGKG